MNNENGDLASVIINTYYRNDTLRAAIESALDQSYHNVEVLVVDDSGEGYAEPVATEYDIEYVDLEETQGLTAARHIGLERSEGRYIQFLDDDDWLYEDKLAEQIAVFEDSDDVGVVYCGFDLGGEETVRPDPVVREDTLKYALRFQMRACKPSTALLERDAAERILPGDESLWHAEDIWMWIELASFTEFDFVDEVLAFRGADEDSLGTSVETADTLFEIIEKYESLYDRYPAAVRKRARSSAHFRKGRSLLWRAFWSPTAIRSFALALYLVPSLDRERWGFFLLSLFGKPGYVVGSSVYNTLAGTR